jgi:hypothetical protein
MVPVVSLFVTARAWLPRTRGDGPLACRLLPVRHSGAAVAVAPPHARGQDLDPWTLGKSKYVARPNRKKSPGRHKIEPRSGLSSEDRYARMVETAGAEDVQISRPHDAFRRWQHPRLVDQLSKGDAAPANPPASGARQASGRLDVRTLIWTEWWDHPRACGGAPAHNAPPMSAPGAGEPGSAHARCTRTRKWAG